MIRLHFRHIPFWLLTVSTLALSVQVAAAEPHEYLLSNGMKVLLVEMPKAPVATVQVWYKVGSSDEVMGRAGLSDLLERMRFRGTAKYPKGSFSRLVRQRGGLGDALHSHGFTAYFENGAAGRGQLALGMERGRMRGVILDQ